MILQISGLGTTPYSNTTYLLPDQTTISTSLAARAISEYCHPDKVVVLATSEAKIKNWDSTVMEVYKNYKNFPELLQLANVPKGDSEKEFWEFFEICICIFKEANLGEKDRLILDISNGFRAQPTYLVQVSFFFFQLVEKKPQIQLFYGSFEKDRSQNPVWDLTPVLHLNEFTVAMNLFLKSGYSGSLETILTQMHENYQKRIWQGETEISKKKQNILKEMPQKFKKFGEDLLTARTHELLTSPSGSTAKLLENLSRLEEVLQEYAPPLREMLEKTGLQENLGHMKTDRLDSESGKHAIATLAKFYLSMNRYLESIATIREGWISLFGVELFENGNVTPNSLSETKERRELENLARKQGKEFLDQINIVRNDLEHASYRTNPKPAQSLIRNTQKLVSEFKDSQYPDLVFVNISNHPSDTWSEKQKKAVGNLRIVDISFPNVSPDMTLGEVKKIVDSVMKNIPANAVAAMIQGEFTLTTCMVCELQKNQIRCYAATTERIQKEGSKVFEFVQFREYPQMDFSEARENHENIDYHSGQTQG